MLKKKVWANFQRIIELFALKILTKLSKRWVWDPGSGKNLFRISYPESRGQKGTGFRIRIRNIAFNKETRGDTKMGRQRYTLFLFCAG
jgi:hypothetical protein